jgi:hypothetical protein
MHEREGAIGEVPKNAEQREHAYEDLYRAKSVDLQQTDVDAIKIPRKILVLYWCNDLVNCPEEDKPNQPNP